MAMKRMQVKEKDMLELFSVKTPAGVFSFSNKEQARTYRDEYNANRNKGEREVGISYGPDHRHYRGARHG
jgi:hypothetical protein